MDLDALINKHYGVQLSSAELLEEQLEILVDEVMGGSLSIIAEKENIKTQTAKKFLLTLPKFSPNESWGDPDSYDRKMINQVFSVVGGGATITEKLEFIQRISDKNNKITSPRRIISTLIILESLSAVIKSFSYSAAGFVFEGFIAALLRGKQESEISDKGNLPIQDLIAFSELHGGTPTPVSLKLLSPKGDIKGSYTNLVDALDEFGQMVYLIARKSGTEILLEEYTFTRDNFINSVVSKASGSALKKTAKLFTLPKMDDRQSIEFINSIDNWEEKYEILQQTAGYSEIVRRKRLQGEDEEEKKQELNDVTPPAQEEEPQLKEDLHQTIIEEYTVLNESDSQKTQWSISAAQLPKMPGINYKTLGSLPYDPEIIVSIAEQHMDKLGSSLVDLFESTKNLSENVNKYFTIKERSRALKSGEKAITNTRNIQKSLQAEINRDSEN